MAPMLRDSRDLANAASTSPAKAIRQINFSNVVRVDGEGHESLTHVEAFTTRPHLLRTYLKVRVPTRSLGGSRFMKIL